MLLPPFASLSFHDADADAVALRSVPAGNKKIRVRGHAIIRCLLQSHCTSFPLNPIPSPPAHMYHTKVKIRDLFHKLANNSRQFISLSAPDY